MIDQNKHPVLWSVLYDQDTCSLLSLSMGMESEPLGTARMLYGCKLEYDEQVLGGTLWFPTIEEALADIELAVHDYILIKQEMQS